MPVLNTLSKHRSGANPGIFFRGGSYLPKNVDKQPKKTPNERRGGGRVVPVSCISMIEI